MIFNSPKNFKRGRLIKNRYRPIDLIVIASAVVITLILEIYYLVIMQGKSVIMAALFVIPAVIAAALIIPFGLYHNVMELSRLYIVYLQIRKKWMWEGIYKYELIEEKEND